MQQGGQTTINQRAAAIVVAEMAIMAEMEMAAVAAAATAVMAALTAAKAAPTAAKVAADAAAVEVEFDINQRVGELRKVPC